MAIRAAFKAVLDGKQVAVLAPTTILAEQHFETFGRRVQGFPVDIRHNVKIGRGALGEWATGQLRRSS